MKLGKITIELIDAESHFPPDGDRVAVWLPEYPEWHVGMRHKGQWFDDDGKLLEEKVTHWFDFPNV